MTDLGYYCKLSRALLLGIVVVTVSACGGGGSNANGFTNGIFPPQPIGFDYGEIGFNLTVGQTISPPIAPNPSEGTLIITYSVTPALPDGLVLNSSNGVISGTPTVVSTQTKYTITGTSAVGTEATTGLTITVGARVPPPFLLPYQCDCSFSAGQPIKPLTPLNIGGQVDTCVAYKPLPSGLILNSQTCEITGTPTSPTSPDTYTIVASNSAGQATINLKMAVLILPVAPTKLSYGNENFYTFTTFNGQPISPLIPSNSGGQCKSYSVKPALPNGLNLGESDGIISGTPKSLANPAEYTITCDGTAPLTSTTVPLRLQVVDKELGFLTGTDFIQGDVYYDGFYIWAKISDIKMPYDAAKSYCQQKAVPASLKSYGKRWDLPGSFHVLTFSFSTIVIDNNVSNHGWQLGEPGFWVEPNGNDRTQNFSYIADVKEQISLDKLANGNDTPLFVACFLER